MTPLTTCVIPCRSDKISCSATLLSSTRARCNTATIIIVTYHNAHLLLLSHCYYAHLHITDLDSPWDVVREGLSFQDAAQRDESVKSMLMDGVSPIYSHRQRIVVCATTIQESIALRSSPDAASQSEDAYGRDPSVESLACTFDFAYFQRCLLG
ncbi:hypothetical protein Tco_0606471 [Tanacetum coccineum]